MPKPWPSSSQAIAKPLPPPGCARADAKAPPGRRRHPKRALAFFFPSGFPLRPMLCLRCRL
eukprot:6400304-Lingulodinium_polyedra.AAC.1